MKMRGKMGELTSTQIVTLVLAIMGFAIVLLLFFSLKDAFKTDDEICKLSVIGRASVSGTAQGFTPLKCTTGKICLTDRIDGKCDQFVGEEDVVTIRMTGTNQEKALRISEESAKAMYSCWQTMGEGKLDLFSNAKKEFGIDSAKTTCVICSRVAIDKEIDVAVLRLVNINKYLETHTIPDGSKTYLQAFTDNSVQAFPSVSENPYTENNLRALNDAIEMDGNYKKELLKTNLQRSDGSSDEVNREMAFVFSQIRAKGIDDVLEKQSKAGILVIGSAFVASPTLTSGVAKAIFTPWGAAITVAGTGAVAGYGAYNAYQGQLAAAGYCGDFVSGESSKEGCSIVQGVNYNFRDINAMCGSIQGNP